MVDFNDMIIVLNERLFEKHERLDCYHFLRILRNVLVKLDSETRNKYFSPFYLIIESIIKLDNISLAMLLTFYYKGSTPISLNTLKSKNGFGTQIEMNNIMKKFLKKGLAFVVQSEDITLISILEMLTIKELNTLHKKFCKTKMKFTRLEISNDIINIGKQRNLMGKNVGVEIKNCAIDILSGIYKFNPSVHKLISAIIALHYPDLMDIRNEIGNNDDSIMGKIVLQFLSRSSQMLNNIMDNSDVVIIKLYYNFIDIIEYVDAIEMLRKIQLTDDVKSETFISILKYAGNAIIEDSEKILKWLSENVPIRLLQYTRVSIVCSIFYVAAEKFVKVKEYKIAESLYQYITEDKNLIPFIGSKKYSEYWIRRCINIKHNGNMNFQKEFYKNASYFSKYFLEATKIEIDERESKLIDDKINVMFTYENEEISLPILKKTGSSGVKNQFFLTKNDNIYLVNVEKAVLEHYMSTNKYTHGGHFENKIWIETFYLIFADIVYKQIDSNIPYNHEFVKIHPLLGSKEFVKENLVYISNRYNTFVFGTSRDQYKIVKRNMKLFWHLKDTDDDCIIFKKPSDFFEFINCMNIQNLTLLCINQMSFKRGLFSGYPDLVLWNVETRDISCFEVKGPGDTLTCKQKLAIKILNTFLCIPCKCINVKAQSQNPSFPIIT